MVAPLTTSTVNQLGQYSAVLLTAIMQYVELAISSLAPAMTIASTYYAFPERNIEAECKGSLYAYILHHHKLRS